MRRPTGFLVVEYAEDFEQTLKIENGDTLPPGGVLDWRDKRDSAALFPDRKTASDAIDRTEHYRLAFGTNHPERKRCKIVPVAAPQPTAA